MTAQVVKLKLDSGGFNRAVSAAGAALAAIGGTQMLASIVRITATFEDLTDSLKSVYGTATLGKQAFAVIEDFAKSTQFGVEDLTTTFIKLRAAGITPTRELLSVFTDTAAVTTDQMGALAAMTDLFARTTEGGLNMEDINRLGDRGIPILKILKEELNLTKKEIAGVGATAKGAKWILDGLTRGLHKTFGGATQEKLDNTSTLMSNFMIQVRSSANAIGTRLTPALNNLLVYMTDLLDANGALADSLGRGLGTAIEKLNDALVFLVKNFEMFKGALWSIIGMKLVTTLYIAMSTLNRSLKKGGGLIKTFTAGLRNLIPAMLGVNAAMLANPFTAIALAITGLIAYIVGSNGLLRSLHQLGAAFDYLVGAPFAKFTNWVSDIFGKAIDFMIDMFNHVVNAMRSVYNFVARLIPGMDKLEKVARSVGSSISSAWDSATGSVGNFIDHIKEAGKEYDEIQRKAAKALETPGVDLEEAKKATGFEAKGGIGFGAAMERPIDTGKALKEAEKAKKAADRAAKAVIKAAERAAAAAARELEAQKQQIADRFETLQAALRNETDAEIFAQDERLLALKEYHEKFNLKQSDFNNYQQRISELHAKNIAAIAQRNFDNQLGKFKSGKYAELDFTKFSEKEKAKFIIEGGKQALTALGQHSKEAFMLMKGVAMAEAVINIAQGVTKALAQGGIFGPLLAGIIIAVGAAQIATIASQQYTGRRFGGPVTGGKNYMVGESGPEMFVPSGSGQIMPNRGETRAGDVNVNFNIQAIDAQGLDQVILQRRGLITNIVRESIEQQGRRSPV